MPNAIEHQQHAENIESAPPKREWVDPDMMEVMRASDACNHVCGWNNDGIGWECVSGA